MKVRIEVTDADLDEMGCDTLDEFEKAIRYQLDNGVVGDDGSAGEDWIYAYELEVVKV